MLLSVGWIAFSSVLFYVDFEKRLVTKAKAIWGRDVWEWSVATLDEVEHLEIRGLPAGDGSSAHYELVAKLRQWHRPQLVLSPVNFEVIENIYYPDCAFKEDVNRQQFDHKLYTFLQHPVVARLLLVSAQSRSSASSSCPVPHLR